MEEVTVSQKYQVVIPASIREELHIKPGERVVVLRKNGLIHLIRVQDVKKAKGMVKGVTTKNLRDERERIG